MIVRRECDLKETRCANPCRLDTRASAFFATVTARPRLRPRLLEPVGSQPRPADFRASITRRLRGERSGSLALHRAIPRQVEPTRLWVVPAHLWIRRRWRAVALSQGGLAKRHVRPAWARLADLRRAATSLGQSRAASADRCQSLLRWSLARVPRAVRLLRHQDWTDGR